MKRGAGREGCWAGGRKFCRLLCAAASLLVERLQGGVLLFTLFGPLASARRCPLIAALRPSALTLGLRVARSAATPDLRFEKASTRLLVCADA